MDFGETGGNESVHVEVGFDMAADHIRAKVVGGTNQDSIGGFQ